MILRYRHRVCDSSLYVHNLLLFFHSTSSFYVRILEDAIWDFTHLHGFWECKHNPHPFFHEIKKHPLIPLYWVCCLVCKYSCFRWYYSTIQWLQPPYLVDHNMNIISHTIKECNPELLCVTARTWVSFLSWWMVINGFLELNTQYKDSHGRGIMTIKQILYWWYFMVIYTHYIPIKPKYTKTTSPIMVGQIQHYIII